MMTTFLRYSTIVTTSREDFSLVCALRKDNGNLCIENMGGVSLEPMVSVFSKAARQIWNGKPGFVSSCDSLVPRISCVGTRRSAT